MFRSRLGLLWATLGMAIGTGNIWRFPRMVAKYNGGAYILVWLLGLVVWSFPLLFLEAGLGRSIRKGVLDSFRAAGGTLGASAGVFVTIVTMMIAFYYAVVTGWCAGYLVHFSLLGGVSEPKFFWDSFHGSWESLVWMTVVAGLTGWIVAKGVASGIERATTIMVPFLFLILVILVLYTTTLPYSSQGFERIFHFSPSALKNPRLWIDAFSQSAWSTGAGWGLYLTYLAYSSQDTDIEGVTYATGFGNNLASLLAASAIIPMIWTLLPRPTALKLLDSGNSGLAFIAVPLSLSQLSGILGWGILVFFFLGLLFAALSSLISMYEMLVRILEDLGMSRLKGALLVTSLVILIGAPSALFPAFFDNQDWVWGVGLLISGLLLLVPFFRKGPKRFVEEYLPGVSPSTRLLVLYGASFGVPIIGVILLGWYTISTGLSEDGWSLGNPFSLSYMLGEWGVAGLIALVVGTLYSRRNRDVH